MAATMDDMRALRIAQTSTDPNQTLHRVRALAFGHFDPPPAAKPDPVVPKEDAEKSFFRKKKVDDE